MERKNIGSRFEPTKKSLQLNNFSRSAFHIGKRISNPHPSATWVHLHWGIIIAGGHGKIKGLGLLFRKLQKLGHFCQDGIVVFGPVGLEAAGTVLDSGFRIGEAAAAPVSQGVEGAVAKEAIEILRVRGLVAGKILALPVLKIAVICHRWFLSSVATVWGFCYN